MKENINTEELWNFRYDKGVLPEKLVSGVHANLYQKLADFVFKLKNRTILDIGAGVAPVAFLLRKRNFIFDRYVAIDFSKNGLSIAKDRVSNIETHVAYVDKKIKIKGIDKKSFDLILCTEVLEHITNYNLVLANIAYFLSDSGTSIVSIPAGKIMIKEHYHMNILVPDMIEAHRKVGLNVYSVIKIDRWNIFKSNKNNIEDGIKVSSELSI